MAFTKILFDAQRIMWKTKDGIVKDISGLYDPRRTRNVSNQNLKQ